MDLRSELETIVAVDRIRIHREEIERHGRASFTYLAPHSPDAGVSPKSREEVVEVLRFADGGSVPVVLTARGAAWRGTRSRCGANLASTSA